MSIRLFYTVGRDATLRVSHKVLVVGRSGRVTYRPVGYGLTIASSALQSLRQMSTHINSTCNGSSTPHCVAPTMATHPQYGSIRWQRTDTHTTADWTTFQTPHRAFHARGKDTTEKDSSAEEPQHARDEGAKDDTQSDGDEQKRQGPKKAARGRKYTFGDHIRGLRKDYATFPDIYNSANAINFAVFTIFCLCSTGSNTEEKWWLAQWGLDNTFRPLSWLLHSFLTTDFLSMTYAMILLHTLCHTMLPALGSRGLLMYVGAAATVSGVCMFVGNKLYYGSGDATERQFGPWDVIAALFVMQYIHYGITPILVLNSFNGWIRYACWVGGVCILYFDWQPTLAGTLVGLALCKGVPQFKLMKAAGA